MICICIFYYMVIYVCMQVYGFVHEYIFILWDALCNYLHNTSVLHLVSTHWKIKLFYLNFMMFIAIYLWYLNCGYWYELFTYIFNIVTLICKCNWLSPNSLNFFYKDTDYCTFRINIYYNDKDIQVFVIQKNANFVSMSKWAFHKLAFLKLIYFKSIEMLYQYLRAQYKNILCISNIGHKL